MKKVVILASLLMSASVLASTNTETSNTSFTTDAYATKQQAYDAAFNLMDEMKVDVEQVGSAVGVGGDDMTVPDLFAEGSRCGH